jgi:hypothetical protein
MTRRGVRPPPPPTTRRPDPLLPRARRGPTPNPTASAGLLPTRLLLPRARLSLRPGCGGPDSGRGAAAPSLLVPAAEAEAGDPDAVRRLPPYSRGSPSSRRSCRGEVAADRAVRPACGGGGIAGVGNGGPAAGGGVVVAWRRRAPACLAFFSFFCAVSIWVAHDKERVTPSRWGRPPTPFLCRASHFAHDKGLCRALPFPTAHGKGLCRAKMRRAPFAVRPSRIRTAKAVPCGFWPQPCARGARQSVRIR